MTILFLIIIESIIIALIVNNGFDNERRMTRQEKVLKDFPNAEIFDGTLCIPPCAMDKNLFEKNICDKKKSCWKCHVDYWNEVIL